VNCDPIARWYRWLEYFGFGRALERRRYAFLPQIRGARRALVLGEGDGRFLVKLVEQNRGASIDYVDLSARMLALARQRAGDSVHYIHGDALSIPLPASEYDLVVTHFFLDCFNESDARKLIARVAAATRPGALWLISEFAESNALARGSIKILYAFFRLTTGLQTRRLVDHGTLLREQGFILTCSQSSRAGMLVSELWRRRI
jgi:ubiquinone/menaquinone biosynthesis C-methylase UbiE